MTKRFIYSLLFIFLANTSLATHNMAGDITYKYIGTLTNPYRYQITVKTYTKWIIGSSNTDRCTIVVYFGDGDSATAPRVNGPSFDCPTADGVVIGGCSGNVKKNIYETIHDYPGNGLYTISMEDPNRSAGICNIPSSENTSFSLEAELTINPFFGNNSGPVFNQVPILCDTIGIIGYYNPLAVDSDGDSLFYEFITPLANGGFVSSYTLPYANNTFTIDTGTVTWNTPAAICQYIFDIRITEWRNIAGTYYSIGKTIQEVSSIVTPYLGVLDIYSQNTSVTIFPNPSNGLINLTIENGLTNQQYQITICNSIGQIVKTIDITTNSSLIVESELAPGIYFYSLSNKYLLLNKGKFVILNASVK
ncbi:MAG: T9SS type A sorting domain-containing protein [Bacteroidetes bacterium]|nr:T9SS type A sorting domain-containing protein [Bacteroidota bacterium]